MSLFGKSTAFALAAAGMLAWVSPSHAYRMMQVSNSGRYTAASLVTCDNVNGFVHWTNPNVQFRIGTSGDRKTAILTAMNAWTNVAGASHVVSEYFASAPYPYYPVSNADGVNGIWFIHDPTSPCTGNCLAITALSVLYDQPGHTIQEADIVFNMSHTWNTDGSNYDVQAVTTHEIGHALGIHHSEVSGATMYQGYTTNWRSLESDDVQALQCSEAWYVSPIYEGALESANCRAITGWARNTKRPNGYAWVEVWNGNLSWKDTPANLYRADVGYHAFSTPPPGYYRSGNYHTITAKFPNGATVPGSHTLICQVGIFRNQTPASFNDTGGVPWSVGNVFSSSIPGYVTHLRYYKAAEEAGIHTLKLWTESGQPLGSVDVDFGAAGTAGWKTGKLAGNGVQIQAGTNYVVSVTTYTKQSKTDCGFSSSITNGPITGHGGKWVQGDGVFPTNGSCSNFWTDLYFDQ